MLDKLCGKYVTRLGIIKHEILSHRPFSVYFGEHEEKIRFLNLFNNRQRVSTNPQKNIEHCH